MVTRTRIFATGGRRLFECPRSKKPLISIVSVVFNARDDLGALLKSIFASSNDRLEIIVIDAGSVDGTLELLKEHDSRIDYWVSEPDGGILRRDE